MAPKRLSKPEKESILQLYRHPTETTSTLAARFGVSSSTISRVLKQGLSTDEYEALVQQKRTGVPRPFPAAAPDPLVMSSSEGVAASRRILFGTDGSEIGNAEPTAAEPAAEQAVAADDSPLESNSSEADKSSGDRPGPVLRKRVRATDPDDDYLENDHSENGQSEEPAAIASGNSEDVSISDTVGDAIDNEAEDDLDEFQDDDDLDDDEDDLDTDDDYDDDSDGDDDDDAFSAFQVRGSAHLDVRPLSEAQLPRTCYLVIDRAAELITRPLSDFADLGHIPSGEVEEKTLPVFDNHRVAKRFSNRRFHRIVKVPDSRLLQKTTAYLQAKGITRLLFDGQVYALSAQNGQDN
ncbi:MAG: helix-turn-helix domain-containing protein [Elainellaceae cyanobacterium]